MKGLAESKRLLENAVKIEFAGQSPFGLLRLSETGLREFSDRL
jgi:hypothetical protein